MFYNLLMSMASFDLLPSDELNQDLFSFEDDDTPPDSIPDNFQMMDIF